MLAASVGDKVWSWEIRSGLANETHAKGFAQKPPLSTPDFDFVAGFAMEWGKKRLPLKSDLSPATASFKYMHKIKAKNKEVFLS